MNKLGHVRYLELASEHIAHIPQEYVNVRDCSARFYQECDEIPKPNYGCPSLNQIFPRVLEVLKIIRIENIVQHRRSPTLWAILGCKDRLITHLRKLALSVSFWDESMFNELKSSSWSGNSRNYSHRAQRLLEGEKDESLLSHEINFDKFRSACNEKAVNLAVIYEDPTRREIFGIGAPPPVWKLPEEIEKLKKIIILESARYAELQKDHEDDKISTESAEYITNTSEEDNDTQGSDEDGEMIGQQDIAEVAQRAIVAAIEYSESEAAEALILLSQSYRYD